MRPVYLDTVATFFEQKITSDFCKVCSLIFLSNRGGFNDATILLPRRVSICYGNDSFYLECFVTAEKNIFTSERAFTEVLKIAVGYDICFICSLHGSGCFCSVLFF